MVPAMDRWSSLRRVCSRTSTMPSTPFIGVLISWLMAARKADFARVACSAASRASRAARSACFCGVMSTITLTRPPSGNEDTEY